MFYSAAVHILGKHVNDSLNKTAWTFMSAGSRTWVRERYPNTGKEEG